VGKWAEKRMRSKKLIGVHLDMTNGVGSMGACVRALEESINTGLALAQKAAAEEVGGNVSQKKR
jgi:hypothetical protein